MVRLFDIAEESDFLTELEKTITKLSFRDYIPSTYYKPSKLNCLRQMFYYRTKTQTEQPSGITADVYERQQNGEDRHVRIQTAIAQMKLAGYDCEYIDVAEFVKSKNLPDIEIKGKKGTETKCYNKKYDIMFMCDGIIRYKGLYYILEIKTEGSEKWNLRFCADESHIKQITSYSLSFGINDILFLYENRDTFKKKVYFVTVTKEMREELIKRIETCNSFVEKNELPDKEKSKICMFCEYKSRCNLDAVH